MSAKRNTNPPPLTPHAVDALVLDTQPWLSCEECFERMDTHVEALLRAGRTDPAMDKHLLGCPACAEEAQSLLQLLTSED